MKTINIKGKEYAPVSERIKEFRKKYPDWALLTEIVSLTDASVVVKASVVDDAGRVRSTGYAQEDKNASNINKTSYVENGETSAVGRALGMLGIGICASVSSADEVANAVQQQEIAKEKIGKTEIAALKMACEEKGSELSMVLSYYGIERPEDMTRGAWNDAMKLLAKKK